MRSSVERGTLTSAPSLAPRVRAASIDSITSAVSPLWERATTRLLGVRKCS